VGRTPAKVKTSEHEGGGVKMVVSDPMMTLLVMAAYRDMVCDLRTNSPCHNSQVDKRMLNFARVLGLDE
jgi:hypothetical protein